MGHSLHSMPTIPATPHHYLAVTLLPELALRLETVPENISGFGAKAQDEHTGFSMLVLYN